MSGGIRTSVKGYLIAKRLSLTGEIDTVHEMNEIINTNFTALQAHNVPSTPQTEGEILLKRFLFNELKIATWNFHPDNMVGVGGFGYVFKGWVDGNSSTAAKAGSGMLIAVKTIDQEGFQGQEEWLTEIYYLGRLRHPNLVKLLGYCFEDNHRLLVYEFMPHGSLEIHLYGRDSYLEPLSWTLRMKIALGIAKVLAFLHGTEGKVIHRDVKTSNILLDSTYNAKLSDFGLAKDVPAGDESHVLTRVVGTHGYGAPEYISTGHLSCKSDVYGFGVVMLEMLSGRRVLDNNRPPREHNLVEWAKPYLASKSRALKFFDAHIEGQYSVAGALKAANLANRCISAEPEFRPNMNEVVTALEQLQESGDMEGLGISQNEPRQTPCANLSNRRRSTSWISFRPCASRSYT